MSDPLRLLIIGAHPDDADYHAGGTAALYRAAGHAVKMVSLTNGNAGHHLHPGPELASRLQVIRLIRAFRPDLVLTHRPNDYHPDHRYTSQVVQDAAYMVTVPAVAPDTPHLARDPVIAYLPDDFQKPYPFQPSVVVDIGNVFDRMVAMLHCHTSQFYEWLPFHDGYLDQVPAEENARLAWLAAGMRGHLRAPA